jgi:hypothetical protein
MKILGSLEVLRDAKSFNKIYKLNGDSTLNEYIYFSGSYNDLSDKPTIAISKFKEPVEFYDTTDSEYVDGATTLLEVTSPENNDIRIVMSGDKARKMYKWDETESQWELLGTYDSKTNWEDFDDRPSISYKLSELGAHIFTTFATFDGTWDTLNNKPTLASNYFIEPTTNLTTIADFVDNGEVQAFENLPLYWMKVDAIVTQFNDIEMELPQNNETKYYYLDGSIDSATLANSLWADSKYTTFLQNDELTEITTELDLSNLLVDGGHLKIFTFDKTHYKVIVKNLNSTETLMNNTLDTGNCHLHMNNGFNYRSDWYTIDGTTLESSLKNGDGDLLDASEGTLGKREGSVAVYLDNMNSYIARYDGAVWQNIFDNANYAKRWENVINVDYPTTLSELNNNVPWATLEDVKTDTDVADMLTKKHEHDNKDLLDKIPTLSSGSQGQLIRVQDDGSLEWDFDRQDNNEVAYYIYNGSKGSYTTEDIEGDTFNVLEVNHELRSDNLFIQVWADIYDTGIYEMINYFDSVIIDSDNVKIYVTQDYDYKVVVHALEVNTDYIGTDRVEVETNDLSTLGAVTHKDDSDFKRMVEVYGHHTVNDTWEVLRNFDSGDVQYTDLETTTLSLLPTNVSNYDNFKVLISF